jgi:hypothetical protein
MQGLIQHLRRDVFEVYAYAILPKRDPISEGIRSVADHYEELAYDVSQAVGQTLCKGTHGSSTLLENGDVAVAVDDFDKADELQQEVEALEATGSE